LSGLSRRAAYLKWGDPRETEPRKHTWDQVAEMLGKSRELIRGRARYYKSTHPTVFTPIDAPQLLEVEGVAPDEHLPDEDKVFARACNEYDLVKGIYERKRTQHIDFDRGPVAIVWAADHHFGDSGVDYKRAFKEAELIRDTPGMWLGLGGDMTNSFIIGTLRQARDDARLSIPDEWSLLRRYLRIVASKLLFSIPGNHTEWNKLLTGIDYFADVVDALSEQTIYDSDDIAFTLNVGGWSIPCRARHKWRGLSIYNDTHEIERAAKFDQDFLIGFGAHTHKSGLARDMNVGGRDGMALLAGSYKRIDTYARRGGFTKPNKSTAVAVVIDEDFRSLTGFNDLATCANYMQYVYE